MVMPRMPSSRPVREWRRHLTAPVVGMICAVVIPLNAAAGAFASTAPAPVSDPLRRYMDTICRPALEGRVPAAEVLHSFYHAYLATETRAQVGVDQFTAFWTHVAEGGDHLGYGRTVNYVIQESGDDRVQDEVSVNVVVTRRYQPGVLLLFIAVAWDVGVALGGGGAYGPYFLPEDGQERAAAAYRLTRESVGWRLVLPDREVAAMQRYPSRLPVRRYTLDDTVSAHGLTLRVRRAVASSDGTVFILSVDNAGGADARTLAAFSLATLTGADGRTHPVRILRSAFPEVIPAGMSGIATLAFDPIPNEAGEARLLLPGVQAADQFDVTIDLHLRPVK